MESSEIMPENIENALTSIRDAYTLASTSAPNGEETDQIAVNHFLSTLAKVAVNITTRRKNNEQTGMQESGQ
jgi:hypothetical protein